MLDLSQVTITIAGFRDGLGERLAGFDRSGGQTLELLRVRPELAAMESALVARASVLAEFKDQHFLKLRGPARHPGTGQPLVASEHVEGERLSEILARAHARSIVPDVTIALHIVIQVLQALAALEKACRTPHGALGLERVIVTPHGRVVVADYMFAPLLQKLNLRAPFIWRDLRIAMPVKPATPRFDTRADVAQSAVMLLACAIGRPLMDDEYPDRLAALAGEIREIARIRGGDALADGIGGWLDAALPTARKGIKYSDAAEARFALERALPKEPGIIGSQEDVQAFLEQIEEPEAEAPAPAVTAPKPPRAAAPAKAARPSAAAATPPAPKVARLEITQDEGEEIAIDLDASLAPEAPKARSEDLFAPVSHTIETPIWLEETVAPPEPAAEPAPPVVEEPIAEELAVAEAVVEEPAIVEEPPIVLERAIVEEPVVVEESVVAVEAAAAEPPAPAVEAVTPPVVPTLGFDAEAVAETTTSFDQLLEEAEAIARATAESPAEIEPAHEPEPPPVVELEPVEIEAPEAIVEAAAVVEEPVPGVVEEPAPVVIEEPAPVVEEPVPVAEEPALVVEEPVPVVVEEPAPVIEEPVPVVVEEPAPVIEEPVPVVVEELAPVIEEPVSVAEEPAPVLIEEPAPVVEEPVPVVVEAPMPVVEEPVPVIDVRPPVIEPLPVVVPPPIVEPPPAAFRDFAVAPQAPPQPVEEPRPPVVEGRTRLLDDVDLATIPDWMLNPDAAPPPEPPRPAPPLQAPRPAPPPPPPSPRAGEHWPTTGEAPVRRSIVGGTTGEPQEIELSEEELESARATRKKSREAREEEIVAADFEVAEPVKVRRPLPLKQLAAIAAVLIALAAGGYVGVQRFWLQSQPGTVVIDSTPSGSEVFIDGAPRGQTPLTVPLPPGDHLLSLRRGTRAHTFALTVVAGGEVTQTLDWGTFVETGALHVTSDPEGATVLVDGQERGATPLDVTDLAVGSHTVAVRTDNGSVTNTVRIKANETASLNVAVFSGWLAIFSPVELKILERGRLIGTSSDGRIMVRPGRHQVELVNEELGYRSTEVIEVGPGEVGSMSLEPKGQANINAIPWAEVFVDGQRLGETPLANVPVTIGTREFVFKHPELGERRVTATVTMKETATVSVDLTKQ